MRNDKVNRQLDRYEKIEKIGEGMLFFLYIILNFRYLWCCVQSQRFCYKRISSLEEN